MMVKDFIDTDDPGKTLVLPDRLMINQCFYHFKTLYKQIEKKKGGKGVASGMVEQSKPDKNGNKDHLDSTQESASKGKNNDS